jgi:hypothetical protein
VVKVTHDTGLCAVHAHEPPAVTVIVPEPEVDVSEALTGEIV